MCLSVQKLISRDVTARESKVFCMGTTSLLRRKYPRVSKNGHCTSPPSPAQPPPWQLVMKFRALLCGGEAGRGGGETHGHAKQHLEQVLQHANISYFGRELDIHGSPCLER